MTRATQLHIGSFRIFGVLALILCLGYIARYVYAQSQALDAVQAEVARAASPARDVAIFGKLELPKANGPVVVRFNYDAFVEFPVEAVVPNSITALSRAELRELSGTAKRLKPQINEWFHVKVKYGTKCTLHYRTVSARFVLDDTQKPFYIDTEALKVVYLEKKGSGHPSKPFQISCDDDSEDRTNKEVIIYTNRACCCNNNHVEAYGKVSCDDGWRGGDCW